jgi:hypothetical protein
MNEAEEHKNQITVELPKEENQEKLEAENPNSKIESEENIDGAKSDDKSTDDPIVDGENGEKKEGIESISENPDNETIPPISENTAEEQVSVGTSEINAEAVTNAENAESAIVEEVPPISDNTAAEPVSEGSDNVSAKAEIPEETPVEAIEPVGENPSDAQPNGEWSESKFLGQWKKLESESISTGIMSIILNSLKIKIIFKRFILDKSTIFNIFE